VSKVTKVEKILALITFLVSLIIHFTIMLRFSLFCL